MACPFLISIESITCSQRRCISSKGEALTIVQYLKLSVRRPLPQLRARGSPTGCRVQNWRPDFDEGVALHAVTRPKAQCQALAIRFAVDSEPFPGGCCSNSFTILRATL